MSAISIATSARLARPPPPLAVFSFALLGFDDLSGATPGHQTPRFPTAVPTIRHTPFKILTMKFKLVAAAFLFISAQAQAVPASDESIERLLNITKAESLIDSIHPQLEQLMRQSMQQSTQGKILTPEQKKIIEAMPAKFAEVIRQDLNWNTFKPQFIQLYRETFEQEELDGLIAFYQSPAGLAYTAKMPLVMQKSMLLGQNMMKTTIPKLHAVLENLLKEANLKP